MTGAARRLAIALVVITSGALAYSGAAPAREGSGSADVSAGGAATARAADPSEEERAAQGELRELARAWSDGGGRFGFPYWDKAAHRWRDEEIPTALFREYVSGYRDRLVGGCELLRNVDVTTDVGDDVRELVVDSCERRVDGLRSQQRWLDEQIRRDAEAGLEEDEATAIDERLAELETETNEAFQESFRDARLAMDLAQSELDAQGADRLAEDAFV